LNGPHSLAVLRNGDILITDTWNNRLRRIDARTGLISTVAGTGEKGYSGDGGPAVAAKFGGIYCASVDAKGDYVYLADLDNRRIRKVNLKTGQASLVAGNGQKGVPRDDAEAISAALIDPRAVTVDRKGNVYILERSGNALRVVDLSGKIRTVAGTGEKGSSGDSGEAIKATMNGPKHLCVDLQDNVIIADTENHMIRKYIPATGRIVRVAGSGKRGTAGIGGPPEEAELNQPHGVTIDRHGILYISDSSNNRVLKIAE
jgi:sugar lactone lactonase YvrE